ncbi:MAG: ABC transporter ATP-binding protein [Granulosicoccus sp.]
MKNIKKCYGSVTAIENLSLDIPKGEIVTLLGPSGCGKTTTLRIIAGLEQASKGDIYIGKDNVTHQTASYRNVAMVFQSYALFPHMNVLDNVSYGLSVSSTPKKNIKKKVLKALSMVGLSGFERRLPSELSGGQQQRVAVARAVVLEPDVLLFDEPLSNLDAKLRRHVREEIRQIQQSLELSAVYVTHDQEEAMAVSDKIVVMKDGEIAQQGTPTELYEEPQSVFIADFIGDANIIPCEIQSMNGSAANVKVATTTIDSIAARPITGKVNLAVQPQHIRLAHSSTPGSLGGRIQHSTYLGRHMEYIVNTDAGDIFVIDTQMREKYAQGESVYVHLDAMKTILVPVQT